MAKPMRSFVSFLLVTLFTGSTPGYGQEQQQLQLPPGAVLNPWIDVPWVSQLFPLIPDLENFDARYFVIIPATFAYFKDLTPTLRFADPTSVIWVRALRLAAVYDATAPYHPTAVGIYTRLPRQEPPSPETELLTFNTAIMHAAYQVFSAAFPEYQPAWEEMMVLCGLNSNDTSVCKPDDTTCTPASIGNAAGLGAVEGRMNDGFNWDGTFGRSPYYPERMGDYTGYQPVNTPYELLDAGRWQPGWSEATEAGWGVYKAQQFRTPQFAYVEPYVAANLDAIEFDMPEASDPVNYEMYKEQADAVLEASAGLTEKKKMMIEYFDNKGALVYQAYVSLIGGSIVSPSYSPFETLVGELVEAVAAHDSIRQSWGAKIKYDAVRPFSAIRSLYANQSVTAYGGTGKGTVTDLPGHEWRPYTPTPDHPEYPSATACFCTAVAEGWRGYFGSDVLNLTYPRPAGSSWREPGITPAEDMLLSWPTLTDWVQDCATSRVDMGSHFPFAVEQAVEKCGTIGKNTYEWAARLLAGTEPPRPSSRGQSYPVYVRDAPHACDGHEGGSYGK